MKAEAIYERLKTRLPDAAVEFRLHSGDPFMVVERSRLQEVALFLREEDGLIFDSLVCLSAVDYGENYAVAFHLYSIKHRHRLTLKTYVPKDDPHLPSVESVWKAANWHEREAYDLMGLHFDGHPDLRRILLPEDWTGHPLRKDYVFPEEYNGIPCVRN